MGWLFSFLEWCNEKVGDATIQMQDKQIRMDSWKDSRRDKKIKASENKQLRKLHNKINAWKKERLE